MSEPKDPLVVPPELRRVERLKAILPDLRALVAPRAGTLAVGMALITVSRATGLAAPAAMKVLIDDVFGKHRVDLLPWVVLGVTTATLVQAATSYALTQIFNRSTQRVMSELRCKLQAHVMRLPLLYHDANQSGSLGARIMNDVNGLQSLVGTGLLNYLGTLMTAGLALGVMAYFNAPMALLALGCVVAVAMFAGSRTGKAKDLAYERSDLVADLSGRLQESLSGVRVLKAYRAEEREQAIFAADIDRLAENTIKGGSLSAGLSLATTAIWGLVNAVVMFVGGRYILAGELTLGGFFTLTVLLNYLAAPALGIVGMGTMLMEALAGLERMRSILRERPEDEDPRRVVAIGPLRGEVELTHVDFAYAPGKTVLHDISLRAEAGTVTALVGPSGAGKSTITGLIASFYIPTSGALRVDGLDLGTLTLDAYRSQLGLVLQETFLFAGSILENIAFARPSATRQEVLVAARSARVDEFAETLDEGYDAQIGERGVRLSGGQRQRISIARALLADPRILILDEATSSLDTNSEVLIQEALSRLLVGRTTFVVAHRLSTIRRADQILVIDQGRIVERGTHASLSAEGGLYAAMYRKQHQTETSLLTAPEEPQRSPATLPIEDGRPN
jgi:subfamily B ATP-binding cassette protein MsbA